MQTKHTPGPWALSTDARGYDIVTGADGSLVLKSTICMTTDAALIAAAPELLAALRHLLEDAVALNMGESDRSGVLAEARAAIARATGGQS